MNARVILAIAISIISVWAASATTFAILFGQETANIIVAVSTLTVASLGAALGVLSTQANQVTSVSDMPGVHNILVNGQASPVLAKMAMDPTNKKVNATPECESAVADIAKAA